MTTYLPLNKLIPLMLIYCIVTIIGIYHHELWFDEVQHFLLARDSKSVAALFSNGNYDDHVPVWKIFLFFLAHFISDNPIAIQVLHLIIINSAVFIFLRYAPFNLVAKVLIIFGYYFIFEYSMLSRNYALGLLFLFIVCTLLSRPDKNLIKIGVLLILMSNAQEFFAFASVGIFLYLLRYHYEHKSLNRRFIVFTFLFLSGFIIIAIQVAGATLYEVAFHRYNGWWLTIHNVSFAIHGIDKGFIPFPPLHDPNFWNRHLFEGWSSYVKVPVSFLFLAFPVWVIRNSRKALLFYIASSLFLLLFLTMSQMTGSRYYGMFFIYFLTAIWLANYDGVNVLFISMGQKQPLANVVAVSIFYVVLLTQVMAGAYIYAQDYTRPFSQGRNTVAYICEQHLDTLPIVVDGYAAGPPLSAYFRRPVYYLETDTTGSFFISKDVFYTANRKPLLQEVKESKYLPTLPSFILISNRADCDSALMNIPGYHFSKLRCFEGAIILSENYCVYRAVRE